MAPATANGRPKNPRVGYFRMQRYGRFFSLAIVSPDFFFDLRIINNWGNLGGMGGCGSRVAILAMVAAVAW